MLHIIGSHCVYTCACQYIGLQTTKYPQPTGRVTCHTAIHIADASLGGGMSPGCLLQVDWKPQRRLASLLPSAAAKIRPL